MCHSIILAIQYYCFIPFRLQWNLICSKSYYPNLVQSCYFLGFLMGSWAFGNLADVYGRKRAYFMSLIGMCLFGIGCSVATGVYIFFFFSLLLGAFISGYCVVGYALLLEIVGPSKRTFVGMGVHAFFSTSYCLIALLAYYIRGWRTLVMVSSVSGAGLLATWRYREINIPHLIGSRALTVMSHPILSISFQPHS